MSKENGYQTNKLIPSLSEVRRKEREEREEKADAQSLKLLENCIKFYNKNYPKSEHSNVWDEPKSKIKLQPGFELKEALDICTEEELVAIKKILFYAHDERFIVTIQDHNKMNRINAIIKHSIPGGAYLDKLYRLRMDHDVMSSEIEKLEKRLVKDRAEFQKKFGVKETYVCPECERVYKTKAGLDQHMERHTQDKEEKNEKQG